MEEDDNDQMARDMREFIKAIDNVKDAKIRRQLALLIEAIAEWEEKKLN